MANRILIGGALLALVAALWFAASDPGAVAAVRGGESASPPASPALTSPPASLSKPALPSVGKPLPEPEDSGSPVAAPEVRHSDWKTRWDGIPLDDQGRTLSGRGQAKAFNHALHDSIRGELQRCVQARPRQVAQLVTMELFVEATEAGYSVVGAEAPTDAGLDSYSRRCFELAFEQQLEIADAGTSAGVLYRFAYPLQLPGDEPSEAFADGGS